ncbi:hypothetical protein [Bacteroides ihuae]|uniref:hypothetical protein n=1 Tax=Bacteroides ihuae TaxID=1852362 RepID=UPI0008DA0380|nr:hypothetical protein [Bacteroides ihuae]
MTKLIDVYRLVSGVETVVYRISKEKATFYQTIMDKDKVTVEVVTEEPISLQEGDYVLVDGIKYKINRDPEEKQSSEKKHSYTSSFEAPIYTLIDKLFCSKITGCTTFTLTGKLRDFLELLIWNVNYDATDNPKGVDTGWSIGLCPDTDYVNITFAGVTCRDALNTFASKFGVEYYAENKTLNFVSHIEKETGLIFTQGKGEGLYEVDKKNVDDGDLVTRVYAKGGTENVIPGEGDYDGRLILPEGYIENFSDSNRVVEAVVEFDDIHPTFEGAVGVISGDNNREFICAAIDFDLADVAVSDEARVNFLTGDLMGKSFEFKWNNSLKKITLIYQEDELAAIDATTGVRPNIPSASKHLRGGELFNFTGIKLSGTYKTNAITKLRSKATEWLSYYCRKRVKFELNVDYRYLREKNITLHCGDLITINVPLHNISKLIRITSIERNLYTGKLTCVVSNYLDEKWKDKIETEVANIKSSTTTVNGGYGASSVSILETIDEREASDSNVLSSLRALKEIAERALSRTSVDTAAEAITFIKGLVSKKVITAEDGLLLGKYVTGISGGKIDSNGDAEVRNLVARIKATVAALEAKTVTVSDKVTTLNLLVQKLAETYDLNVSNVATLFQTIVKDYVSSESFVPGITGEGMKLYKSLSGDWNLEVDNVVIRKAMTIFELIISKVRAVNGGLVVSPANGRIKSVTETTGSPTYYVLGIEGDMTFAADDLVRCQVFSSTGAKYYWVPIDSVSGEAILILKSNFPDGVVPAVGDDLVQMGNKTNTARQGILYLTASEDGKPRFSVLDGINSTDLTGKSRVILGCLDGITDSDFPSNAQPHGYGLWAGNVFLKGLFILRNGKSIEDELNDQITAVQTAFEVREGQISIKVTQATTAAQTATSKAGEAATSAGTASTKAGEAAGSATTAGQKATDATKAAFDAATTLQAVTQKETSINQTADAIELKATRAESAAGRAESAEASINIKADGIVLQASNKAAQTAVDGVQIGGRNLFRNSKAVVNNAVPYIISNGAALTVDTTNTYLGESTLKVEGASGFYWTYNPILEPNIEYTLSMMVKGNNALAGNLETPLHIQIPVGTHTYENIYGGDPNISTSWKTITKIFKNTSTVNQSLRVYLYSIGSVIVNVAWVKLEKGNKATDWSPAPEDVDANISNVQTQVTNTVSRLTIAETSISTLVSQTTTIGNTVSSHSTSINQLNNQIALKADSTTVTGINTRLTSAEAKITSDAINLTVKSQITTAVNDVQVGGRNLLLNSAIERSGSREYVSIEITDIAIANLSKQVIFSFDICADVSGNISFYSLGGYGININNTFSVTTEWKRFYSTVGSFSYHQNDANGDRCMLSWYGIYGTGVKPHVRNVKVELGNKTTDWSPAPEDVTADAQVKATAALATAKDYANTNFTTKSTYNAGIEVLSNQISSKVSQTAFDSLSGTVNTHGTAITQLPNTIDARITTQTQAGGIIKTQVESWFTMSGNTLSLGAKSVNITGATVFSSLATNDSVANAVNALEIGGRNLVLGSKVEETSNLYGFAGRSVYLIAGQAYTFSFNGHIDQQALSDSKDLRVFFYIPDWSWQFNMAANTLVDSTHFSTFTAPITGYYSISSYLFPSEGSRLGLATVNWYKVEKGSKATDWSPAPEDVNTAITTAQTAAVTTSRNNLATSLGYADYSAMEAQAIAGNTIINGGMIRTSLINADAIITTSLLASKIAATDITTGRLTVTDGAKVGPFIVSSSMGSLTATSGSDSMLLSAALIRFIGSNSVVRIGADTFPGTMGGALLCPQQNVVTRSITGFGYGNVGHYLSVEGASSYDDTDAQYTGNHALYIPKGDICGFRLRIRTISSSQTLSVFDSIIISVSDSEITLTLPASPEKGQMYFIRKNGGGRIWVNGSYIINDGDWYRERSTSVQLNKGCFAIFMYNGTYWTYNTFNG